MTDGSGIIPASVFGNSLQKGVAMARSLGMVTIFIALFALLLTFVALTLLSSDYYPYLGRDAQRLGIFLAAREPCGLESPAGWVDSVGGRYDFDPPASQAFEEALALAKTEQEARIAALSQTEQAAYCESVVKDFPWTVKNE